MNPAEQFSAVFQKLETASKRQREKLIQTLMELVRSSGYIKGIREARFWQEASLMLNMVEP